jgi:hypothetical protein
MSERTVQELVSQIDGLLASDRKPLTAIDAASVTPGEFCGQFARSTHHAVLLKAAVLLDAFQRDGEASLERFKVSPVSNIRQTVELLSIERDRCGTPELFTRNAIGCAVAVCDLLQQSRSPEIPDDWIKCNARRAAELLGAEGKNFASDACKHTPERVVRVSRGRYAVNPEFVVPEHHERDTGK